MSLRSPVVHNVMEYRKGSNDRSINVGIPEWLTSVLPDLFDRHFEEWEFPKAHELPRYIEEINTPQALSGLLIFGSSGSGKTTTVCAKMLDMLRDAHSNELEICFRASLIQMCCGLTEDDSGMCETFMDTLQNCTVLVIDPIEINWFGEMKCLGTLASILEERVNRSRPIIGIVDAKNEEAIDEFGMFIIEKIVNARPSRAIYLTDRNLVKTFYGDQAG